MTLLGEFFYIFLHIFYTNQSFIVYIGYKLQNIVVMMRSGPINERTVQGPLPLYCPMYVFFIFFLLSFYFTNSFLVFLMPYD